MDSIPAFAVQAQSKTAALANPIARYIPEVGAAAADRCGRCGFGTSIFRNLVIMRTRADTSVSYLVDQT